MNTAPKFPVRKNDLAVVRRTTAVTLLHGPTTYDAVYCVTVVSSVSRTGVIKTAMDYCGAVVEGWVSKDRLLPGVWALVSHEYASLEEAREAVRPFRTAPITLPGFRKAVAK